MVTPINLTKSKLQIIQIWASILALHLAVGLWQISSNWKSLSVLIFNASLGLWRGRIELTQKGHLAYLKQQGRLLPPLLLGGWEARNIKGGHNLPGSHLHANLLGPALKFQIQMGISSFSWQTGSWHRVGSILLQGGPGAFFARQDCALRFAIVPSSACHPPLSPPTQVTSVVPVRTVAGDSWICQGPTGLRGMSYKPAWEQLKMQCCVVESSWKREPENRSCRPSSLLTPVWTRGSMGVCFPICKIYVLGGSNFWTQGKSVPHLGFCFSRVFS